LLMLLLLLLLALCAASWRQVLLCALRQCLLIRHNSSVNDAHAR
jgi:hypothetical protein